MSHICHARQCNIPVPAKMFVCKRHWKMLSKELQKKIWSVYVEGQEKRKDPTNEYIEVQKECVEYIASIEFKDDRIMMVSELKKELLKHLTETQIVVAAGLEMERMGLRNIYQHIHSKLGYIDYSYSNELYPPVVRMRFVSPMILDGGLSNSSWNHLINIIYSKDGKKWKVSKSGKLENCLRWLQKVS